MLMTDLPSTNAHSCMISDLAMITNNNGSVYFPVWKWMLSGPTILPVLTSAEPGMVSFVARQDGRYQVQVSTNLYDYVNAGAAYTNVSGTVTASVGLINSDYSRVQVGY
jgi:hypothetical protein